MSDLRGDERKVLDALDAGADGLTSLTRDLVRIPSENTPPTGGEREAQEFIRGWLGELGVEAELIDLDAVNGLAEHELFFRGEGYERRDYADRPNLAARLGGAGGGPTLIVSGHIDTMPVGNTRWTREPFGGQVEGGRVFGRGAMDMKGGIAAGLAALKAIRRAGVRLAGDVVFESVVDEEHGGSNGTLANRLAGVNGDAAVIPEPTGLRLYSAHKGFRIVHLSLTTRGGMSFGGQDLPNPVEHVGSLIECFQAFRDRRRRTAPPAPEYAADPDPVPVFMNKLQAGEFSLDIPMQVPETCTLEVYWQTLPGETREAVEGELFEHLGRWVDEHPSLKAFGIEHRFSHRWMPGSRTDPDARIVRTMRQAAGEVLGREVVPIGSPFPCDMFVFRHFGIDTVIFGPAGACAHGSDEYVEIDSLMSTARTRALSILRFCGTA
ncbi:MAG: M20 family metallopeptidase [Planctomycetota bacterium]|jgi:acetylornithine deacetylase